MWFEVIFRTFMVPSQVMKSSLWVNINSSKLLVTFINFGQVTLIIFLTLGKLKLSAVITLLTLSRSQLHITFTDLGQNTYLFAWENGSAVVLSLI